jgi:basic amino acid/polyamine antiporter, APA family
MEMMFLPVDTWARLVVWLAIGLVLYFAYGRKGALRVTPLAPAPDADLDRAA